MKQKKKKRDIPPALAEGLFTLAFGFAIIVISLFIAILTDIPFEAICILAFFLTICIFIVIDAIHHIKKKEKAEIYLASGFREATAFLEAVGFHEVAFYRKRQPTFIKIKEFLK